MADPVTWIALASAVIGAGTTVYTQGKAEDAAEAQQETDNMRRTESMNLGQEKESAARQRALSQSQQKDAGNQLAFEGQMDAMNRSATAEMRQQEEARLLAQNDPEAEYAAKFKPGSGNKGDDTASSFLVPKIAEGTGLVADKQGGGLQTPLGFDV